MQSLVLLVYLAVIATTEDVHLRDVTEEDLGVFFLQQREPDANAMAAWPSRDEDAHLAHWHKILADETVVTRSIVCGEHLAGNIVSWIQDGRREIGYWIGKAFWGKGIASRALAAFVEIVSERPLVAFVAAHNAGSIRVLEKAGFVRAGRHEEHLIYQLG